MENAKNISLVKKSIYDFGKAVTHNEMHWSLFERSLELESVNSILSVKFMFSKKATKIDEIFTVDLTLCSKCQIDGEDFVDFCDLLRKHEL